MMSMNSSLSSCCLAVAVASVLGFVCGCTTVSDSVSDLFRDRTPVDASVVATWWDGPRIRPGVKLLIQVGTPAAAPAKMEVLVDQNGDITLPLLLQDPVACDGLTLEALKQKLIKAYSKYYRQPMVTVTFAPYDGKGAFEASREMEELRKKLPKAGQAIDAAVRTAGAPEADLRWTVVVGRQFVTWTALLDRTGRIAAYVPLDPDINTPLLEGKKGAASAAASAAAPAASAASAPAPKSSSASAA